MHRFLRHILLITSFFPMALSGQLVFEQTYGGPGNDACQVVNTQDSGFVMLATLAGDSWLVRLDGMGNVVWQTSIPWYDLCAVVPTDDGGFLCAGTTVAAQRQFVSYRVDANGDSLWARVYPDSMDHGLYTLVPAANGGFLLAGYTFANGTDPYILRIDDNGYEMWEAQYGGPGLEFGATPVGMPDGGFALAVTSGAPQPSRMWLIRTDALGDTLWTRYFSAPEALGGATVDTAANGDFLLAGWTAAEHYNGLLIRTDANGVERWRRTFGGHGFESRTARGAAALPDGRLVFVSSTDGTFGPGPDRDIAVWLMDSLGQTERIFRLGGGAEDMPRFFCLRGANQVAVLGYSHSFGAGARQAYLALLGLEGCQEGFWEHALPIGDTLCPGDSLLLSAPAGFAQYAWSTGDSGMSLWLTAADTLQLLLTDSSGCTYHAQTGYLTGDPMPSFGITDLGGGLYEFRADSSLGPPLDWRFGDGGTAQGATVSHQYQQTGNFEVCLAVDLPLCGRTEVCETVSYGLVALSEPGALALRVYPQPALAACRVQLPAECPSSASGALWNAAGQLVRSWPAEALDAHHLLISRGQLPAGLYTFVLLTSQQTYRAKVVFH